MFVANRSSLVLQNILKFTAVRHLSSATTTTPSSHDGYCYETLLVERPRPFVFHVQLNRPDKMNALNMRMWSDIRQCFEQLSVDADCRAIVLSGRGKVFTSGLDLGTAMELNAQLADVSDFARRAQIIGRQIRECQASVSSLELCAKPVLAAVHSVCMGAGVDFLAATDIRYCTSDAWFCVKEVDLGLAADVGTLQRLPKILGNQSLVRELCLTARKLKSAEAAAHGLVSQVFDTHEAMIEHALSTAELIATKSPVGVQATKKNLVYSTEHTNQEGLDQIYEMNRLLLQSEDFVKAAIAAATRQPQPEFEKL